ncbi:BamA/TamA family outer membrane protein [Aquicoccus sp. SU-CL01552]|uniref:autotransporter assembly complex protein TamA n=1 Tax=Aquicoccus sp. SU-CL01552 TaxID=3127656 RepID=UPI0031031A82
MTAINRVNLVLRGAARIGVALWLALAPGQVLALETSFTAPGLSEDLSERLQTASAVMGAEARGLDTVQDLLAAAQADYATLVQVLYDQGYFSPVVHIRLDGREAAHIPPLHLPRSIGRIEVSVDPGRPFRFGRAEVAPLAPGTEIPEGFAPGEPASTGLIRDAAAAGVAGWRAVGHAKAGVADQRITANHAQARLDAAVRLRPGPQLRFGKMIVAGQTGVRDESIRRIAGFPTGEIYDPEALRTVNARLRRTGAFSSVALDEAETANPDGTLDVTATFEDMPKRRISFGAELSSSEGLDLSAAWMHRNLFGGAERLRLEATLSNIGGGDDLDGRIAARLDRPDRLGPDDSIFYLFELERLDRTNYEVTRGGLGIGTRRVFSDKLFAELSLNAHYADADDAFGSNRKFRYLSLPLRLEWDRRDSPVNARGGFYLDAEAMPFLGVAGSASGGRLRLDGRAYRSFGPARRITVAGRVQLGSVIGAAQSDVSPDLLFFSGGAGTVRGQPYESLGTAVSGSTLLAGGRGYLGASLELRGQITERISAVGFYDYGAIDASAVIDGNSVSHSGAGVGVRYDIGGFGPIRLDIAFPTSGSTGDGMQFYIGIGQAF